MFQVIYLNALLIYAHGQAQVHLFNRMAGRAEAPLIASRTRRPHDHAGMGPFQLQSLKCVSTLITNFKTEKTNIAQRWIKVRIDFAVSPGGMGMGMEGNRHCPLSTVHCHCPAVGKRWIDWTGWTGGVLCDNDLFSVLRTFKANNKELCIHEIQRRLCRCFAALPLIAGLVLAARRHECVCVSVWMWHAAIFALQRTLGNKVAKGGTSLVPQ